MPTINVRHRCKHWRQHDLDYAYRTAAYYASLLRGGVCPACYARRTAVKVAQEIFSERRAAG